MSTPVAFYVAGRRQRRGLESLAIGLFGALSLTRGIFRLLEGIGSTVDFVMSGILPSLLGVVFMIAGILVYVGKEELITE